MIFYFSATGNSLYVAQQLGKLLNERIKDISHNRMSYTPINNERTILVCAVHSWSMPMVVREFIYSPKLNCEDLYVVFTCGDNCGNADKDMISALKRKKINLRGCYSVQMPNTYVLMKGFGLDEEHLQNHKLKTAIHQIQKIAKAIQDGYPERIYERGNYPWLKTAIVHKLFCIKAGGKTKFYTNSDCTGCGKCENVCPTGNIELKEGKVVWSDDCTQCCACYHNCPSGAINWKGVSEEYGQYLCPIVCSGS